MIILDTNVVSAAMRSVTDAAIAAWLDARPVESLWLTTVTVFEIRMGIETLTPGRRRRQLQEDFARVLSDDFQNRILPLDEPAAQAAGILASQRRRAGRSVEVRDTLIAGIVISRKADFVTGNVRRFQDLDIRVIDPWVAP
jgi:predicted nucleic acid-binding protein